MKTNLTFGADPEVFLVGKDNKVLSPAYLEMFYGLVPVKDDYKHPIYIDKENYSWMMDGVAFELTLKKPFQNPVEMYSVISESLEELNNFANKLNLFLYTKPVVDIEPKTYLEHLMNEKMHQGFIFGCDPDKDAFLGEKYVCDELDVKTHLFRYGGGHFHCGSADEKERELIREYIIPFIQLMAVNIGNLVISNSKYPELEKLRAKYYGMPGRYRLQPHGSEYRSPSNYWITKLDLIKDMFEGAKYSFYLLNHPEEGQKFLQKYSVDTVNAIMNVDVELARKTLNEIKK